MKKLLLIIFVFSFSLVQSQNYELVKPSQTNYFTDVNSFVHSLKIDTLYELNGNTIYNSFKRVRKLVPPYNSPSNNFYAPIFGNAMIEKANLDWEILNGNDDTIYLKPNSNLNTTWIAYDSINVSSINPATNISTNINCFLESKVSNIEFLDIYGVMDSIKTISFTTKNYTNNNTLLHPINNLKLKISQNYGLIETLDFGLFPDINLGSHLNFTAFENNNKYATFELESIYDSSLPREEIFMENIFDYEIGDIIQTKSKATSSGFGIPSSDLRYFNFTTITILSKIIESVSIMYSLQKNICVVGFDNNKDSIVVINHLSTEIEQLEIKRNEVLYRGDFFESGEVYEFASYYSLKKTLPFNEIHFFSLTYNYVNRYDQQYYILGVGGPFYNRVIDNGDYYTYASNKLNYYKKGNNEYGVFLPICLTTNIEDIEESKLTIFPNPSNGSFKIILDDLFNQEFSYTIVNINGKVMYQNNTSNIQINLEGIVAKGVYFIKVSSNEKQFVSKIVIQ